MINNDLKFFTNEPERDLYTRFSTILKSNTQFFDALVGYFRSSGFFKLYESLETVDKIRILVGLNVDCFTMKIIDQANNDVQVVINHKSAKKVSYRFISLPRKMGLIISADLGSSEIICSLWLPVIINASLKPVFIP